MPFYNGTLFEIDKKEMMRYAGLSPKAKEFPQGEIDKAVMEALALAEPKGIWQILPYDPVQGVILGDVPLALEGRSIKSHLKTAWSVAVLAVSVGDDIEEASTSHFKNGDYLRGLLLDAAATAATEHLADQVNALIDRDAHKVGQKTTWRFSPGYGDWPVTQQKDFCRLIHAEEIGIHVTDHSMLFPRKSVSAIIGISTCTQRPAPMKCRACGLRTCPFRNLGDEG